MDKRPENQSEWKNKRQLHFQASPEMSDAAEQMAESQEGLDERPQLKEAKDRSDEMQKSLEGRFKTVKAAIDAADLPPDKKDALKAQLDAKQEEAIEAQIDGASKLGKDLNKHLTDLEQKIGEGKLNKESLEGLKVAVDGLQAENLKTQIKTSNVKEGTNRAIAYATAPVDFALGLVGNAVGLTVGHTIRMIGTAIKSAKGK